MSSHRTATLVAFVIGCGADPGGSEPEPEIDLELVGRYLTGVHPVTAAVADLDGDGDLDLAVPGLVTPELVVLENDAGQIRWHPPIALADGAMELAAIDLDGDGRVELAASHREIGKVVVYAIGDDLVARPVDEIEIDGLVTALKAIDLDGDGDDDLAVSRFSGATVELLRNDGGRLTAATSVATEHGPFAIRLADLDGDGARDMAVLAAGADRVEVFAGSGFDWSLSWTTVTDQWPSSLEVVDLDGDGAPELVGTASLGDRVFAIDVGPDGGHYRTLGAGDGAFGVSAGDADGDGALELAVSNKDAGSLAIFVPSSLSEGPALTVDVGDNTGPSPIYRWDLDNDGTPEMLAVVCAFVDQVSIFRWR